MVSEASALVVLDRGLQQLALSALLVEELLHVGARQQVRLRDAEDLERSLLGHEATADSQPLL